MADKAISELVEASQITATDRFVLEQNGTAKCLTGQVLLNWLTSAADGHGGISSIEKLDTSGLVDTYRITLADTTVFDFTVINGRAISSVDQTEVNGLTRTYAITFSDGTTEVFTVTDGRSIVNVEKTATAGLTDTYTVTYNDGSQSTLTVTNGAKGDPGDTAYLWIKFASQEPTEESHDMGDLPDDWIGFYAGFSETAPESWMEYQWFQIKGEQGDTGEPATLVSASVTYQVSDSGTITPSGVWSATIPAVAQGKYLWTRIIQNFNSGDPVTAYTVSRMGVDGLGSVVSVCGVDPDNTGNVALQASHVGALPAAGGDMSGAINMNAQPITGLATPTEDTDAANKGYVDTMIVKLWENASPTSEFLAQEISIDLTEFALYIVTARIGTGIYPGVSVVSKNGNSATLCAVRGSDMLMYRAIVCEENMLNIQDAYKNGTVDNTYLIPTAIYGMKGA